MRQFTIPIIAGILILVGLYFFPLGEDVVFKAFLDYAGGDYWTARLYQYVAFGALLLVGFLLLRYSKGALSQSGLVVSLMLVGAGAYLVIGS